MSFYSTVVVITDQYPPSVTGGAELSLHAQISSAKLEATKVVVIALDPTGRKQKNYRHEGVEVHRVPFDDRWPVFAGAPSRKTRYLGAIKETAARLSEFDLGALEKMRTVVTMHKRYPTALGRLPNFDQYALQKHPAIATIRALVERFRADVIHADNYRSIVIAAALNTEIPVVSSVRDNRFFCAHRNQAMNIKGVICESCRFECTQGALEPALERKLQDYMAEAMEIRHAALRQSAAIVATSEYLATELAGRFPAVPVERISNITESPNEIEKMTAGIKQASPPEILCVGMIGHNKGQNTLISLLPKLCEQVPDCRIVLAGRGAMTNALQAKLRKFELQDKVVFAGFLTRPELYRAYARASVVVCPNIWPEPFGRVPLEAALASKPVVAFDTGGLAENIVHQETGLLAKPGDVDALTEHLVTLVLDPAKCREMGSAARQMGEQRHAELRPGFQLEQLWQRIIETNKQAE